MWYDVETIGTQDLVNEIVRILHADYNTLDYPDAGGLKEMAESKQGLTLAFMKSAGDPTTLSAALELYARPNGPELFQAIISEIRTREVAVLALEQMRFLGEFFTKKYNAKTQDDKKPEIRPKHSMDHINNNIDNNKRLFADLLQLLENLAQGHGGRLYQRVAHEAHINIAMHFESKLRNGEKLTYKDFPVPGLTNGEMQGLGLTVKKWYTKRLKPASRA